MGNNKKIKLCDMKQSISYGEALNNEIEAPVRLSEVLLRASSLGAKNGIVYINDDEDETFQSYGDLLNEAERILSGLRGIGLKPHDKVVFQLNVNQDFIPAFWGCVLGGIIPVPLATPLSYGQPDSAAAKRLVNTWGMFENAVVLTNKSKVFEIKSLANNLKLNDFRVETIDALRSNDRASDYYTANQDDTALLLPTSGSTGTPKTVVQNHFAILQRSRAAIQINGFSKDDVSLNWFPMDHVGGLVMFHIRDVYSFCNQIQASTNLILQQPLKWLDLIDQYHATITWAPNFAFGLINENEKEARGRNWDMSSMKFVLNGGEAVVAKSARKFMKLLMPKGLPADAMHPAWGMAETCSGVVYSDGFSLDTTTDNDSFVEVGSPVPGFSMRIVDDANLVVEEGVIGEVQVKGESVTRGYYENPQLNSETFTVDGWFRTGDLGFIRNGRLTVTGREKDVIIVNGLNYFCHEIESMVEEFDTVNVSFTAAVGVRDSGSETDKLAIFFNTSISDPDSQIRLAKEVRGKIAKAFGVSPRYLLPVDKETVPKTAIGKIKRSKLKERFEAGDFNGLVEMLDAGLKRLISEEMQNEAGSQIIPLNDVEKQVADIWQEVLDLPMVGMHSNFFELGGHSLLLIQVHSKLQNRFGKKLSLVDIFRYPTVHAQASYLGVDGGSKSAPVKERIKVRDRKRFAISQANMDVAVIGMACRFPGADNINEFWSNLENGREFITFFTDEELLASGVDPRMVSNPNYVKANPILSAIEEFDAEFFGFTAKEAMLIDPQQRLFLECSWEAMEDSGYNFRRYEDLVGVFAGASMNTYLLNNLYPNRKSILNSKDGLQLMAVDSAAGFQMMVNNDKDFLTTRVSYKLNLRGPSMNVQTACSTSLVAIHLAYKSLISGECDISLAGGVSIKTPQKTGYLFEKDMILSSDGHCRAFDASADGTIFGNGAGVVVLKRLKEAIADRDHIYAVIKGSGVSNDGGVKVGYTAPSQDGEAAAAIEAISMAGVTADSITYLEAHGTGTAMGDPIEAAALTQAFEVTTDKKGFCAIGSVKTNVGHLQIASGVVGFIKTVLALKNRKIPPSLHFKEPNPAINFEDTPFYVNTKLMDWQAGETPRRAGVNSLGIGGANAHIVLEEPSDIHSEVGATDRRQNILTLSARTEKALRELALRYKVYLNDNNSVCHSDICFTANTGRVSFEHRLAFIAGSSSQLSEQIESYLSGKDRSAAVHGMATDDGPKIAFLFTGQGSQYSGMGSRLYDAEPVFRESIDKCAKILKPYMKMPLLDVMYPDNEALTMRSPSLSGSEGCSLLDETAYTQPVLFALEYALSQLWMSWGVTPDVLMGHSVGEYVAACLAGVFSLEDGLKLIACRARLIQDLPRDGSMVAVLVGEAKVAVAIKPFNNLVSIAAVNGPENVVISGKAEAVNEVVSILEKSGVVCHPLNVSHAFHSSLMEPALDRFMDAASDISYSTPEINIISNVSGQPATADITTPEYWLRHMRHPVRFFDGMQNIYGQGCNALVEIGAKPVLLGMARKFAPESRVIHYLPGLRQGSDDLISLFNSLGSLYVNGAPIEWSAFYQNETRQRVPLPTYPFQRQKYWVDGVKEDHGRYERSARARDAESIIGLLDGGDVEKLVELVSKESSFADDKAQLLPGVIKALVNMHKRQQSFHSVNEMFYRLSWVEKPSAPCDDDIGTCDAVRGNWLILADKGGVGLALANLLKAKGDDVIIVYAGDEYGHDGNGVINARPESLSDFESIARRITEKKKSPLLVCVYLWALDATTTGDLDMSSLNTTEQSICGGFIHLLQGFIKRNVTPTFRLWMVTRGAVPVNDNAATLAVAQAPLRGLGAVCALEHPDVWGGMIDLSSEPFENEVQCLFNEIVTLDGESQLAFSSGKRYVARVVRSNLRGGNKFSIDSESTYLITGGFGALGLKVCQWLIAKGAQHIVLISRSGGSEGSSGFIKNARQTGVDITSLKADVAVEEDMLNVFNHIASSMPPLKGVIHTAGTIREKSIVDLSLDALEYVFRPKVSGAWLLHQLTKEMELEFFVNFSSIASIWGSSGQAHYAAANHFLDVLSHYRQGLGLPALNVNWGPWSGGGMVMDEFQKLLVRMGVNAINPDQAINALESLLESDAVQTIVVNVEWGKFKEIYELKGRKSLFEDIKVESKMSGGDCGEKGSAPNIAKNLECADRESRDALLIDYLQNEIAGAVGVCQGDLPDMSCGFVDMGFDSLRAIEFKNKLNADLNVSLPATLLFDFPTLEKLATFIAKDVLKWDSFGSPGDLLPDVASAANGVESDALSEIENLSEGSVDAQLEKELAEIEDLLGRG